MNFRMQKRLASAFGFGAFVFLFLYTFTPFGLDALPYAALLITGMYGAATTVIMLVLNILIPTVASKFFSEENWTVLREIFWTLLNVFFIALANMWLSVLLDFTEMSWLSFQFFIGYTMAIGIIPITISVLLAELRLRKKFETGSAPLNKELESPKKQQPATDRVLKIVSENSKENLEIAVGHFLYIRAAENYIDVFWIDKNEVTKTVLRNSLKSVADALAETHPNLLRCHKSFLVNLSHVKHVSGNAQGYKLHLKHTEFLVPVSRQLNDMLPKFLAAAH